MELAVLRISKRALSTKNTASSFPSASFISPFADVRSLFINVDWLRQLLGNYILLFTVYRIKQCLCTSKPLICTAERRSIWHHYKAISSWSSVIKSVVPYSKFLCNRYKNAIHNHKFSCSFSTFINNKILSVCVCL